MSIDVDFLSHGSKWNQIELSMRINDVEDLIIEAKENYYSGQYERPLMSGIISRWDIIWSRIKSVLTTLNQRKEVINDIDEKMEKLKIHFNILNTPPDKRITNTNSKVLYEKCLLYSDYILNTINIQLQKSPLKTFWRTDFNAGSGKGFIRGKNKENGVMKL